MDRMDAPTLDEALEGQQRLIAEKLQSTIENENLAYYKRIAEEMLEENDSVTVVAAALKMMTKEPDTTPIALTSEPPVVSRGGGSKNAAVTEADTVMVTVIVVVMDAVAMVVTVTAIVMVVIVTVTVIAIVKVAVMVTVVVVVKVKVAQDLQTDAAKENIIAVSHKLNKKRMPFSGILFYFCNCTYYIITCVEMRCYMLVRLGYVAMSVHLKNASPSQTMTYAQFQK